MVVDGGKRRWILGAASGLVVWDICITSGLATSDGEVTLRGGLPRTSGGAVDIGQFQETVNGRFAQGVREL